MARLRFDDYLQNYRFWLLDVTPRFGAFPFFVMNPLLGFQSSSSPEITLETQAIRPMNSMWERHSYSQATCSPITLTRGVHIFDSSFFRWTINSLRGTDRPVRNLLLIQYMGWNPITSALGEPMPTFGPISFGSLQIPGKAWMLYGCIPTRYKGASDFDAMSSDVSVQELEIQPEAIEELSYL